MGLLLLMGDSGFRPLLDSYTAAVGYSLRRLRTAYTGSAVRVRRSSDNAEQDIGFSSNGLINTGALLSFCGAGNGFVTTWYDQVGSNNAVQATAGNQPQIVSSGSVILSPSNRPVVEIVDSSLVATQQFLEFDPWHTAAQAYVGTFSVYSMMNDGNFPYTVGSNPNDRGLASLHNGTTRQVRTGTGRAVATFANGAALTVSQVCARHDTANRTNLRTFLDLSSSATIDVADNNSDFVLPTKYYLGNTGATAAVNSQRFSEFIGFTVDQTANQLAIRTNQIAFWRP